MAWAVIGDERHKGFAGIMEMFHILKEVVFPWAIHLSKFITVSSYDLHRIIAYKVYFSKNNFKRVS